MNLKAFSFRFLIDIRIGIQPLLIILLQEAVMAYFFTHQDRWLTVFFGDQMMKLDSEVLPGRLPIVQSRALLTLPILQIVLI